MRIKILHKLDNGKIETLFTDNFEDKVKLDRLKVLNKQLTNTNPKTKLEQLGYDKKQQEFDVLKLEVDEIIERLRKGDIE